MSAPRIRIFYRLSRHHPPELEDYRTQFEKRGEPEANATEADRFSWFGLSAFLTEEATRVQGTRFPRLGHLIVRYHIPEGADAAWRQTTKNRLHYDLRGDE